MRINAITISWLIQSLCIGSAFANFKLRCLILITFVMIYVRAKEFKSVHHANRFQNSTCWYRFFFFCISLIDAAASAAVAATAVAMSIFAFSLVQTICAIKIYVHHSTRCHRLPHMVILQQFILLSEWVLTILSFYFCNRNNIRPLYADSNTK